MTDDERLQNNSRFTRTALDFHASRLKGTHADDRDGLEKLITKCPPGNALDLPPPITARPTGRSRRPE
jgi:hypothetical protein